MIDTIIVNGTVITATGQSQESIGIKDGLIDDLYEPGSEPDAAETIDAKGLAILPGVVDMHCHHRQGSETGGYEYKETIESATIQCAAGGVTTSVAMPNVTPPPNSLKLYEDLLKVYEKSAVVDYNVNPAGTVTSEIPGLSKTGLAAFKIFMVVDTGRDYPHMPGIGIHDHGKLMEAMEACAAVDVPLMVHPHDQALMAHIEQQFWDRGERDALAYAKAYSAHDGVIWDSAISTLLRIQKATGVHLHLLHIQTAGSVELLRQAKAEGQRVTAEINPWALFLGNDWSAIERLGSYALSYYVPEKNTPVLWEAFNDGTIDIMASDHAPHTREEKEVGWTDGWKAHTGTPSTQHYMSFLLDAAAQGKTTLERIVEATSTAPADIFGMQGKGHIEPGYHADLVLCDLEAESEIRDEDTLGLIGWSPYAGCSVKGIPVRTILRGKTVFADGKVTAKPGNGQYVTARHPAA